MGKTPGFLLRESADGEGSELFPDLRVRDLIITNTSIKRIKGTGAPVHFFDVCTDQGSRLAMVSLIYEQSSQAVRDHGNICINLAAEHTTGPRLAEIGRAILDAAFSRGLEEIAIIVTPDHKPSIEACELAGPADIAETVTEDGKVFLRYRFRP